MSTDLGLPWSACEADVWSVIVDAEGDTVARFCDSVTRDHALACVQALDGIDPTKLPAVFEAIRALDESTGGSSMQAMAAASTLLAKARAAGIIGDKT